MDMPRVQPKVNIQFVTLFLSRRPSHAEGAVYFCLHDGISVWYNEVILLQVGDDVMTDQLWEFSKRVLADNGYSPSDWISAIDFYHYKGGSRKRLYAYTDPDRPFRILAVVNAEDLLVLYTKDQQLGSEKIDDITTARKHFTDKPHSKEVEMPLPKAIQESIDPTVALQLKEGQEYILVRS